MKQGSKVFVRRKSDGRYLVLRSGDWPERPDRDHKLDLPGGFVEDGESPDAGALRELMEETAIVAHLQELKKVYEYSFKHVSGNEVCIHFYLLQVDDVDVALSWEHEAFYWYTVDELESFQIREPFKKVTTMLIKGKVLG